MTSRYFKSVGLSFMLFATAATLPITSAAAAVFIAKADMAETVDSTETGLRHYPGATRVTNDECVETNASGVCKRRHDGNVKIDFSIGAYGLKLIVAKWQSRDSATDIAAFYQRELARFGNVLDCSQVTRKPQFELSDDEDNTLTCDSQPNRAARNKPEVERAVKVAADSRHHYRVGTKSNQRIVAINQKDGVNEIQLVYVNARLPDWMKSNSKTSITVSP
jgi:hypothetical protein